MTRSYVSMLPYVKSSHEWLKEHSIERQDGDLLVPTNLAAAGALARFVAQCVEDDRAQRLPDPVPVLDPSEVDEGGPVDRQFSRLDDVVLDIKAAVREAMLEAGPQVIGSSSLGITAGKVYHVDYGFKPDPNHDPIQVSKDIMTAALNATPTEVACTCPEWWRNESSENPSNVPWADHCDRCPKKLPEPYFKRPCECGAMNNKHEREVVGCEYHAHHCPECHKNGHCTVDTCIEERNREAP